MPSDSDVRIISRSIALLLIVTVHTLASTAATESVTVTARFRPGRPLHRFIPSHALGAAIDADSGGTQDRKLTPANIQAMLSAGLKALAYRLRTELAIDAWHWNPRGRWSEPTTQQGYWISDRTSDNPILLSYGYHLPRRGSTIDQADNESYSRLDDGDPDTFWKSNPYLDRHFTGDANSQHPQWIVVDFGKEENINTVRLNWAVPFATKYEVQFADFDDISDISLNPAEMWRTFPKGRVIDGKGSDVVMRVAEQPVRTRYIRIVMSESSANAATETNDIRDRLGYAMKEISAGLTDDRHPFDDYIHHSAHHEKQTVIYVSSTDPWHSGSDMDYGIEEPGFDRIFQSGLTNGLPMLVATGLLYDTPENAVAEIQYLKSRGYSFNRVELGEEPDGQYVTPEDYGALYLEFARAIHRVDPDLQLGGPSFQEIMTDEDRGSLGSAWLARFLKYLKQHASLGEYSFFSFEWYPFDDACDDPATQLAQSAGMIDSALADMRRRGLSPKLPWIISEYGYSAFASHAAIGIEGALLNADLIGRFLTLGGDQTFLYGYTPGQPAAEMGCSMGGNMLFSMDNNGSITHQFAGYFGARLLTQTWLGAADGLHDLVPVTLRPKQSGGKSLLTAYAVHRPDGLWSFLIINKDSRREYRVRVELSNASTGRTMPLQSAVDFYQFSRENYQLSAEGSSPYPIRSLPPTHRLLDKESLKTIVIPSYSLTVIRGRGPDPRGH